MIRIINGDLLNSNAHIIAHQVNCSNAMNSGVAKQIRQKYPYVFNAYRSRCELYKDNRKGLLGMCQVITVSENQSIANLFGQLGYGYDGKQYTNLDALKKAMLELRDIYLPQDETVAFPYGLGSVRGGAKWEDVYEIIEEVFNGYDVEIWRLDKG